MSKKRFNYFDNAIIVSKKIEPGDMKLEEAKNEQNVFKSNLSKMKKDTLNKSSKKEHVIKSC